MFRISQYMKEILSPTPLTGRREPPGPVVIWNLIRRCNLTCMHCYSISTDIDFPGELSTDEVFSVMDDLKKARVPALILSGGEPLLRPDLFDIAARAKAMGFYTALSTNGTLIDAPMADRIATLGFDYVGISLDGLQATHDRFRRKAGAFEASMNGLRLARDRGVKVGVRFTPTCRRCSTWWRPSASTSSTSRTSITPAAAIATARAMRRSRRHAMRSTCCSNACWRRWSGASTANT